MAHAGTKRSVDNGTAPRLRPGLCAALVVALWTAGTLGAAQRAAVECRETSECRQMAVDAAARGAYEAFHDLVWRAIQTGRPDDPELLYLLARAQSLSNRPHDALVVLGRLADRGMVFDAETNEDLSRVRRLAGWPALEARIRKAAAGAVAAAAAPSRSAAVPASSPAAEPAPSRPDVPPERSTSGRNVSPPVPKVEAPPARTAAAATVAPIAPRVEYDPLPVEEALRFEARDFVPGGLAYDAVSARFVLASVATRSLVVVGDGTRSATDLVRGDSAGFAELGAIEIDRRRGDLWVVSTQPGGSSAALHKLQLISGRSLATFDVAPGAGPVGLVDLAVTPTGVVLVLDGPGKRILRLRPGSGAIDAAVPLDIEDARSLAATADERTAFVAVPSGLLRVDLMAGTAAPVAAPAGVNIEGVERIRWRQGTLIAVQSVGGERRIATFRLNGAGRAIVGAPRVHAALPAAGGPTFATVVGNDFYFLAGAEPPADSAGATPRSADVLVRRIALR
jgi:hypothetical protein